MYCYSIGVHIKNTEWKNVYIFFVIQKIIMTFKKVEYF